MRVLDSLSLAKNRMMLLFTIEGILITLVNNLIGNNNNLLATRMGASDFEISLVITLPQLVAMLVLIPGGILTDRMSNKRNMVVAALASLTVTYVLLGFVPMLGTYRLSAFLILLAISTGPMTIYNISWQAYFSDVVDIETRNNVLTARTGITFLIGTIITLISGALLASSKTNGQKLMMHQLFFWIASIFLIIQIMVLKKIHSNKVNTPSVIKLRELKTSFLELKQNKKFLSFMGVAIFFYVTWHVDWTLYFIGQVDYLGLNEAWLSYANIGGAMMQFLTVGFWSRLNVKRGVRFAMIFGNFGLALFPLAMIITTSIPVHGNKLLFVILNTLANFAMATITLNILQCLLQVIPEQNKTLNIALYTILVTLSNAFMPLIGIWIYTVLGANLLALHRVFWGIFALRIISTLFWVMRYLRLKNESE